MGEPISFQRVKGGLIAKSGLVAFQLSEVALEEYLVMDSETLCQASERFATRIKGSFGKTGAHTIKDSKTNEDIQLYTYRLEYVDQVWVMTDEVQSSIAIVKNTLR